MIWNRQDIELWFFGGLGGVGFLRHRSRFSVGFRPEVVGGGCCRRKEVVVPEKRILQEL